MIEAPVQNQTTSVVANVSSNGTSVTANVSTTTVIVECPVYNGRKGDAGEQGVKGETGEQGPQGVPGTDGHSPVLTWSGDQIAVDGIVSGPHLTGPQGVQGLQGPQGEQGLAGADGSDAAQLVYIQQTRPAESGPWAWWVTDAGGNIVNLIINNGV